MKAPCPGCGTSLDYKELPAYSTKRQKAGAFCPHCGTPLDEETALGDPLAMGASSEDVNRARVKAAKAFHAASSKKG